MKTRSNTAFFTKGMRVRYIPTHAFGDATHEDCKTGVVSSTNEYFVFVKYDTSFIVMTTGDENFTSQATDPSDLVPI